MPPYSTQGTGYRRTGSKEDPGHCDAPGLNLKLEPTGCAVRFQFLMGNETQPVTFFLLLSTTVLLENEIDRAFQTLA